MTIIIPLRKDRNTLSCEKYLPPAVPTRAPRGGTGISETSHNNGKSSRTVIREVESVSRTPSTVIEQVSSSGSALSDSLTPRNTTTIHNLCQTIGSFIVAALFGVLCVTGVKIADSEYEYSPSPEELAVSSLEAGVSPAQAYRSPRY